MISEYNISIANLKDIIENNSQNLSQEFKRLFHGRDNFYKGLEFLTIDSIDNILNVAFYFNIDNELEKSIIEMLKKFISKSQHNTILLQRRYIKTEISYEVIVGELTNNLFAIENGIKIKLNLLSNQNNGYFPDMKIGRSFVKEIAKGKNVLNLFSYTCAFSLAATSGGAKSVVNIDMAKGALTTGRSNHHLNNLDTKTVKFFSYNILKSFSRIKKYSPYDLIIIDPPTFQKGSFEATKDYEKIIKKLSQISSNNCIILSCLNSPNLDAKYLIDIFKEKAPEFEFVKRLNNVKEFVAINDARTLKNLVFQKKDNYLETY